MSQSTQHPPAWRLRRAAALAGLVALAIQAIAALPAQATGAIGPFNPGDLWVSSRPRPALVDIDTDGDLDAFVGEVDRGLITFYRNTGTASSAFFRRDDASNPLASVGTANVPLRAALTFVDWDSDGDQDVFIGSGALLTPGVVYFQNNGAASGVMPTFTQQTSPFTITDNGGGNDQNRDFVPAIADIDGDGDLDAVTGTSEGLVRTFINTSGTLPEAPGVSYFDTFPTGNFSTPTFVDIDADGDQDLFIGSRVGTIMFLRNNDESTPAGTISFTQVTGTSNPMNDVNALSTVDDFSSLAFGDLDADGDLDALVSYGTSLVRVFRNSGTTTAAVFTTSTTENPLDFVDSPDHFSVDFADLSGDGLQDAIIGTYAGTMRYYRNTGTAVAPVFTLQAGGANPFGSISIGSANWLYPTMVDLDSDGDLDLALGGRSTVGLRYYQNTGTTTAPAFTEVTGVSNPFTGLGINSAASSTFGDFISADGSPVPDGLIDMVVGDDNGATTASNGVLRTYRNTGTAAAPIFVNAVGSNDVVYNGLNTPTNNPGGAWRGETDSVNNFNMTPRLVDWDGDGDLDLFVGQRYGLLMNMRNNTVLPADQEVYFDRDNSAASHPLLNRDYNSFVRPTLIDIEGDGDLDAFFGTEGLNIAFARNMSAALPPTLITTGRTTSSVSLSWTAPTATPANPSAPSLYQLERSTNGGQTWSQLGSDLPTSTTSYVDSGLTENTAYVYRIRSIVTRNVTVVIPITERVTGAPGASVSVTTLGPLTAPTNLTAQASGTEIALSWGDTASDETGFRVERSPNGTSGWAVITTTAAGATSYTDTGLAQGTTYYYRVVTIRNANESDASNVASATTDSPPPTPAYFANLPLVVR